MEENSIELIFPQMFDIVYLRNDKKENIKNMRCFPTCCIDGHYTSGFCGEAVHCQVTINERKDKNDSYIYIGELRPKGKLLEYSTEFINNILITEFSNFVYLGKKSNLSISEKGISYDVQFNDVRNAWTYNFLSHKTLKNVKHEFAVIILSKSEDGSFLKIKEFSSPSFCIASQRRGYPKNLDLSLIKKKILKTEKPFDSLTKANRAIITIEKHKLEQDLTTNFQAELQEHTSNLFVLNSTTGSKRNRNKSNSILPMQIKLSSFQTDTTTTATATSDEIDLFLSFIGANVAEKIDNDHEIEYIPKHHRVCEIDSGNELEPLLLES